MPIDKTDNQRILRTLLQVGFPAIIGLAVLLPAIIEAVLDGYGEAMPAELRVWLLGAATLITVTAGVIARVMAIPGVNEWLSKYTPFGTVPRGKYAAK